MSAISLVKAVRSRIIFNSRGEETVEVEIVTPGGVGRVAAPAGKSRGKYEVEYYPSGGAQASVKAILNLVAPRIIGMEADNQKQIDNALKEIDGTDNYRHIGGNAAYAVSIACAVASAVGHGIPVFSYLSENQKSALPFPLGNVLGGGKHAGKGCPDIQEFLVLPYGAKTAHQAAGCNFKVHELLGEKLAREISSFTGGKGDEGGWAPQVDNRKALEMVVDAVNEASQRLGVSAGVGLDVAASSLWNPSKEKYVYTSEGIERDSGEQIDYIASLIDTFKLRYVEDPLHEEDFEGFQELTAKAKKCLICGDDLFVTNRGKIEEGVRSKAANAVIIKPNQIGTITDTASAVDAVLKAGWVPVASHRSGENVDAYLAHLAIAMGIPILKCGVVGGERVAKVNELIRIETEFHQSVSMAKSPI